jgi:hypothetical protein
MRSNCGRKFDSGGRRTPDSTASVEPVYRIPQLPPWFKVLLSELFFEILDNLPERHSLSGRKRELGLESLACQILAAPPCPNLPFATAASCVQESSRAQDGERRHRLPPVS